ncbi:MAG: hypothetical protein JWP12_2244 [Bacteroidetes bacterium]|nr:hypothetical protein [Bacteroidota bacterium]
MKKIYLSLLFLCSVATIKAQYTQGDISLMPQPMMSHDSTTCSSTCNLFYMVTISNSFVNDTVKLKDQGTGFLLGEQINTTGSNPWTIMMPVPFGGSTVTDDLVSGGSVLFYAPTCKVICGPDTLYNISNFYPFGVSNPCQYGMVSGRVYIDNNSDCTFNTGDVALSGVDLETDENLNSPSMALMFSSSYSDGAGMYGANLIQNWLVDYTVSIPSYYQFIFPSTACSSTSYTGTTLPHPNVDFSLQCTSNVDVQCYAGSMGIVRPGQPFYMFPYVSNTGCDPASGQLKLILDSRVIYNAGLSSPGATLSGDTLTWNYSGLTNLTGGAYWNSFFANVHLTPNTSVTTGDTLCFRVMTTEPAADIYPGNNDYTICLPVINSYDPNFKEVSPKGTGVTGEIPATTPELNYVVHFQNTGTAAAYNISVLDTLDPHVIPSSLVITGTSHNVMPVWVAPGVVRFDFNSIMLADSTSNEAASHGYIAFKVNLQAGLAGGTQIKNTADIYFDFNPAVITNTVLNTIATTTGVDEIAGNASVNVYPNPFTDNTTFVIQTNKQNETYSFEMTDVLGKTVKSMQGISEKQFTVSRNGLPNGMYFYKIYSNTKTVSTGKLIVN